MLVFDLVFLMYFARTLFVSALYIVVSSLRHIILQSSSSSSTNEKIIPRNHITPISKSVFETDFDIQTHLSHTNMKLFGIRTLFGFFIFFIGTVFHQKQFDKVRIIMFFSIPFSTI